MGGPIAQARLNLFSIKHTTTALVYMICVCGALVFLMLLLRVILAGLSPWCLHA
jgi:hypothetical protein